MADSSLSRDRIVDVAETIVRHEGIEALGLRRLGRELGVTAPALYGHIENVDDVLRALAERQFTVLADRFSKVRARTPPNRVRGLGREYVQYSRDEPNLFSVLFRFPPDIAGAGVEHELPAATKVFLAASEPLEAGIASGEFKDMDPISAALSVWAAVHGCATALSLDFGFGDDDIDALVDNVLDMVVDGLRSRSD